jgi:hypothetical protein
MKWTRDGPAVWPQTLFTSVGTICGLANPQIADGAFQHITWDQRDPLNAKKPLASPATCAYITEKGVTRPHGRAA